MHRLIAGIVSILVLAAGGLSPLEAAGRPAFTQPPLYNVQPTFGRICTVNGNQSPACNAAALTDIEHGLRIEGAQKIVLPPGFSRYAVTKQTFILLNLVRMAFGLPPVETMNAAVDATAMVGAQEQTDAPVPRTKRLRTGQQIEWAYGSWIGNTNNALAAMFIWVFDDGPGSNNLACQVGHPQQMWGCWGHRENVLANWQQLMVGLRSHGVSISLSIHPAFGAAVAPSPRYGGSDISWQLFLLNRPASAILSWSTILKTYYRAHRQPVVPF